MYDDRNDLYKIEFTEWPGQMIVSYYQLGAADQFQKKLYELFYDKTFLLNLKAKLERALMEITL
ncbi:MAG: hypothetical protein GY870_16710 [archaeon]|nr:hypothetical protein [archaeon]